MMAFDQEQTRNANTIISVGRSLGASDRDIQIALMTSIVESGLRNVSYGDRDSVGLFQQRAPWGSFETRMDPRQSARMFFQGGQTGQPGLFSKTSRGEMSMGQAAQSVQVSAFPDRYAEHEQEALGLLGGAGPSGASISVPTPTAGVAAPVIAPPVVTPSAGLLEGTDTAPVDEPVLDAESIGARDIGMDVDETEFLPQLSQEEFTATFGGVKLPGPFAAELAPVAASGGRKKAVDYALSLAGVPYVWGGATRDGVDCSGLTYSALAAAGAEIPRISFAQATYGAQIGMDQAQPGDLWALDNSSRNNGADHVAFYLGDGYIMEASRPGVPAHKRKLDADEGGWFVDMSRAYA